jgi:arylsulfatase A-like enzyme
MAPNIVLILIDDLGWMDLSCYGSSFYETPHSDALAASGVKFENAYSASPVCSPTRASILSGKYPARVGITQYIGGSSFGKLNDVPYLHYLPLSEKSLATTLKENGYQTWHVGKWHLGDEPFYPTQHGFEKNIGGAHVGHPPQGYFSPYGIETLTDGMPGEYLTDRLTQESIRLIKERNVEKPFFLNLWHYAVHTPIQAPVHLVEKYTLKAKKLGLDKIAPFEEGEYFSCDHKKDQRITRRKLQSDVEYAAMIENLDDNIGAVVQALKDENIERDTIVIFVSDNGGLSTSEGSPTCNAPLNEGKGWNYEGGTRVNQIISWPSKISANTVSKEVVTSTDFYPTLLALSGLELMPSQHQDGVSLKEHLLEGSKLNRQAIFCHYPHYSNQGGTPSASMIMGQWKLIQKFEEDTYELYNLELDISEKENLTSNFPDIVRQMQAMLHEWKIQIEAKIPEKNPEYSSRLLIPKVPNNACD